MQAKFRYFINLLSLLRYRPENLLHKLPNWTSEWNNDAQRMKLLLSYFKQIEQKYVHVLSYVFNDNYIPVNAQAMNVVVNQESDRRNLDKLSTLPDCVTHRQILKNPTCSYIRSIITGNNILEKIKEI
ncbi:uncharacterized protein LOC143262202 [Megalopta genalis]|uniref:uncharacterized protein LOC143260678 n=1 Tax=Megalopta genalis TaxID=115081 RepID=UPI003FD5F3DE